jgi:hypothetical protein
MLTGLSPEGYQSSPRGGWSMRALALPDVLTKHPFHSWSAKQFDIDKSGTLATNIGHDVPNLAPVIHKGSSRVRRSCCHFLIHILICFSRIFSVRGERDVWENNIIQCSPSYTILRGNVLFDLLQGPWPILVINHRLFCSFLETNFMMLLVVIAVNQNQIGCIGNRLTLNPLHMFQIIYTTLQVSHCPDGDRYPIVT